MAVVTVWRSRDVAANFGIKREDIEFLVTELRLEQVDIKNIRFLPYRSISSILEEFRLPVPSRAGLRGLKSLRVRLETTRRAGLLIGGWEESQRLARAGELERIQIGREIYVTVSSLDRFLKAKWQKEFAQI